MLSFVDIRWERVNEQNVRIYEYLDVSCVDHPTSINLTLVNSLNINLGIPSQAKSSELSSMSRVS